MSVSHIRSWVLSVDGRRPFGASSLAAIWQELDFMYQGVKPSQPVHWVLEGDQGDVWYSTWEEMGQPSEGMAAEIWWALAEDARAFAMYLEACASPFDDDEEPGGARSAGAFCPLPC